MFFVYFDSQRRKIRSRCDKTANRNRLFRLRSLVNRNLNHYTRCIRGTKARNEKNRTFCPDSTLVSMDHTRVLAKNENDYVHGSRTAEKEDDRNNEELSICELNIRICRRVNGSV